MNPQCGRKNVRPRTKKHRELLKSLESNLIRFTINMETGTADVVATLDSEVLPESSSDQYKDKDLMGQYDNDNIICWAFNVNYGKNVAPRAGWCTIQLSSIINYDILETGK